MPRDRECPTGTGSVNPALQRWAIAWLHCRRADEQANRARNTMAQEHYEASTHVREQGGRALVRLLDGSRICVEQYRGWLTAAPVVEHTDTSE